MCFNSNRPTVWVEKSKIDFQTGDYGGHFGFPIGMILAIFHLHINLLLHLSFNLVISPCGLRDVKNRFSRWRLWWPSWISDQHNFSSLSHFNPEVVLLLQSKFQLKSTIALGRDVKNWFSRWRLWQSSWIFDRISFSYFECTRRLDAPHQVSTQLDHSL